MPFLVADTGENQSSIVKEALRIGKITDHRLSLIAPTEALRYGEWVIPAGVKKTPVSIFF